MKLGAHMSIEGGVYQAIKRGAQLGCEVLQIFLKNNLSWFSRPYSEHELKLYTNALAQHPFHLIFAHSGYLINLAARASSVRERSIRSLMHEMQLAEMLGLPFIIIHPGAHLGDGEKIGIKRVSEALNEIFKALNHSPVKIALENTAGQGSMLAYTLAHVGEIIEHCLYPERLLLCLDTAHLFQAGYPIHEPIGYDRVINEVERLIGLNRLVVWHLNDSKTEFGSKIDRHESIGKGKIGIETFRWIINDNRWASICGCIETPKMGDIHEDKRNLTILRGLRNNV